MRYLLFLLVVIISHTLNAQYQGMQRTLHWTPVEQQVIFGEQVDYLHFKNATYDNLETLIPGYYEALKMDQAEERRVVLRDQVFEPLSKEEIKNVRHLDEISGEITAESRLSIMRHTPYLEITFTPLRRNPSTGTMERLVSFSIELITVPRLKSQGNPGFRQSYTAHSVLRNGSWYRVKVNADGIYKLTYDQLLNLGIVQPSAVRIYGSDGSMLPVLNKMARQDDLDEIPIWFETGQDDQFGQGDFLLFYGHGPNVWRYDTINDSYSHQVHKFSAWNYYYLTEGTGPAKTIALMDAVTEQADYITETYDYNIHHESNDINLIKSGSEWYGDAIPNLNLPFCYTKTSTIIS